MDDKNIIELYLARDEQAIVETEKKYSRYCHTIAYNILNDTGDADECVNDTYLGAWNSIPPYKPEVLSAYLGKITRNLSLKKWRSRKADKRGGGEQALALDELMECIPSDNMAEETLENIIEAKELAGLIDTFLRGIGDNERRVFICRYWYMDSIADICERFEFGQSKVKMMLARTRKKLQIKLEKEGVTL